MGGPSSEAPAVSSDARGRFLADDLDPAVYTLQVETGGIRAALAEPLDLCRFSSLEIGLVILPTPESPLVLLRSLVRDWADFTESTYLDSSVIDVFPMGHNVWSLLENFDLSATSGRIDVGGMWGSSSALYSSRGSASWTQNDYRLNGLDITEPVEGGRPLLFPDLRGLCSTELINAAFPPDLLHPGGAFDMTTREGGEVFRGGFSIFGTDSSLTTTNISPALKKENLTESHTLKRYLDGNAHASGPLVPGRLYFSASVTGQSWVRDIAEFDKDDPASLASGLFDLTYRSGRSSLSLLWTGQIVRQSTFGAGRKIPFEATLDRKELFNHVQARFSWRPAAGHFIAAGFGFSLGNDHRRLQDGAGPEPGIEILRDIPSGAASWFGRSDRALVSFYLRGESGLSGFAGEEHRLAYGVSASRAASSSRDEVKGNVLVRFFEGSPLEIVRYGGPFEHREASAAAAAFFQDTIILPGHISILLGLHLDYNRGWIPAAGPSAPSISWLHLSPRAGLMLPLSPTGRSSLFGFAGRYYFRLPLSYLTFGNPYAPGGLAYSWNDLNSDGLYEDGESGRLLRREGPLYGGIDPALKRPSTDELSVGYRYQSNTGWFLSLTGFLRRTRNLAETLNTGVPFSSYDTLTIEDSGDDRVPGNYDDLTFLVFRQSEETLGDDFYLLGNPGSPERTSRYKGLDFTLRKVSAVGFGFFLSLTATEAVGTASPGNTALENDDGVIGALYDNPNTLINAEGRLRFDRAYTARLGLALPLPWGIRLAGVAKYYDGQPFARKIIVRDLPQGPFFIMAHPRGIARYEFSMTVDVRLEKRFPLGKSALRIIADGFNITNFSLATAENEWTGPEFPLRYATEIQSPRLIRLGVSYEF